MKTIITSAAALAALTLAAGTAGAAMTAGPIDKAFAVGTRQSDLAEITQGKLALQKASAHSVRVLGKEWIDDHTKGDAKLTAITQAQGIPLPSVPNPHQRATAAALMKLAGAQFDTMWLKTTETGHAQTVALFKKEIASGTDPQLVAYAKKNLPDIELHLTQATTAATAPDHDTLSQHKTMMNGSGTAPDASTSGSMASPGAMAPGAMTPGAMASPGAMTAPGAMASPGATASSSSDGGPSVSGSTPSEPTVGGGAFPSGAKSPKSAASPGTSPT